jgi:hypothetical protein
MLLASALFALFLGGLWLYCLTDAILTPAGECRGMPKPAWIAVIAATFIGGAAAWLIVRQPLRTTPPRLSPPLRWETDEGLEDDDYPDSQRWTDADDAVARHPAGRARGAGPARAPKGPDDDADFLRTLERAIRKSYEPDEETPLGLRASVVHRPGARGTRMKVATTRFYAGGCHNHPARGGLGARGRGGRLGREAAAG